MKISAKLSPLTEAVKGELDVALANVLTPEDHQDFVKWVSPYAQFGNDQLDAIFLVAEVTIQTDGIVQELNAGCSVDQVDWHMCEDEPDIRIDPVNIPLKVKFPVAPFEVSGSQTFWTVLQAEQNIWDGCKDLPNWVWDEGKFDFMLMFDFVPENGEKVHGNQGGEYVSVITQF